MRSTTMRFNKFIFALALMIGVFVATTSAQTITCGTGTASSYTSPFYCLYNNSWHEMIYQPSELGAAAGCSITKIAFQCASPSSTMSLSGLRIYMGTRPTATHESTSDWTPVSNLQLVYNHGTTTIGGVDGWHTFTLDTPFAYDGDENLVVVVAKTAGSGWTSSVTYYYSEVTGSQYPGLYRGNDSDGTYGTTHPGSNTGSQYGYRANTRFTYSNCCTVQRTGIFEFRNESNNPVTYVDYIIGSPFVAPTLVNNLTPAGTPTFTSSNPDVVEVNPNTGALTFHDVEGLAVITAYIAGSGSTCPKSVSYTINSGDGCRKIGTGSSTQSTAPLYGLYRNSYDQIIYTADEIGTAGLITSIGFNASGNNTQPRTVDIYIGETTRSTFSSSSDWIPVNQLEHVYGPVSWTISDGWNMFSLDEPFVYSGVGNLVIAMDCATTSYSSHSFYYTSTSGTTVIYAYDDTYDAVPSTISSYSGSTSTSSSRPNVKICIEPCHTRPENFGFSNSLAMCYLGGQPTITLDRDGNNGVLVWSSSDPSVATVDENGVITTHSLGTTTISVIAPIDGDICSARDSYDLEVICPAAIPSAQSVWVCAPQAVDLTATVRDDDGNLELRWFDNVLADTYVNTGGTYHTNATTTTTYYVAAYNTDQHCYSSRVPSTVHVFDVQYDATTTNVSGYVGVPMYGYPPEGSHEGATFTANGMPAWLTLNSDGSFTGTPTAAGSGSFTITATNAMGCSVTRIINWTVTANNLGCCDFESFYIYQDNKPFPLHLADDGYYYADVCLNTPMTLRVQKLNTCNGTYTYTWKLASSTGGLIQETTGTQMTYTYDRTAGYGVTLQVRRNNSDCVSIPVRVRVAGVFQVATRPSFNLCHGEPFNIYVSTDGVGAIDVVRPSGGASTTLGVTDTVWIPDNVPCNGECTYRSSVTFTDFSSNATVRNANDILYVLLNLEHSYIGDIYIALTCPSGRTAVILPQSGGGSSSSTTCHDLVPSGYNSWGDVATTYDNYDFGISGSGYSSSCDSPSTIGTGWNYIWSNNTDRGYVYAGGTYGYVYEGANVGHDNSSSIDSSHYEDMTQIYHPYEPFSNLVTCPLNGTWSIEVVDGWSIDDGNIFHWELGLNEELLPDSWSYEVDLDSSWVTCGWNSTKSGVYMEITPPDNFNGTETCDLFLRDEYGCVSTYENIVTVTMNPTVHSELVVDEGQCEPYTWARNNQTYSVSGTYVDAGLTPQGCPDTATLVLTVAGSINETINAQACESYTWDANGQTYTQSGTYEAHLTTAMGCDSNLTLNLTISNEITVEFDTTICPDNFPLNNWHGDWGDFTAAGDLQQHFTTSSGCDSLVVLHVRAYSKPNVTLPLPTGANSCPITAGSYVITPTITGATTPYIYNWIGNANSYTGTAATASIPATGTCGDFEETLYFTDAHGCKDTASVQFSAIDDQPPYFQNPNIEEVDAEPMGYDCRYRIPDLIGMLSPADNCGLAIQTQTPLPGNDILVSDSVTVTIEDRCGNVVEKRVFVKVPDPLTAGASATANPICTGTSVTISVTAQGGLPTHYDYLWSNGSTQAAQVVSPSNTTVYSVTVTDANECTATAETTVNVTQNTASVDVQTACNSFTWHGQTFTASNNTATYTTTSAAGCDSIVTLNLTINYSNVAVFEAEACETYDWHGNTYTQSTTTPTFTSTNAAGCDSVTTLHLTVYHSETIEHNVTACDTYTWTIRGNSYTRTSSCDVTDTYTIGTCTGTDILHLTINNSSTGIDNEEACDQYPWSLNGQTYTSSISATSPSAPRVTMQNANQYGCDSTIVLNLTINHSTSGVFTVTECDHYMWPMNSREYYETPTTAPTVSAGLNAAGCDSTVTLHLTINHSTASNDVHTACDSYTWPLNGQTYTYSTNEPEVVITNRAGCDSTVTLRLTINNTRYGSYIDTVCSGEQLTYRGNRYPAGQHTVTIPGTNGCDSVVALQVVARQPLSISIEEFHSCELGHYHVTATLNSTNSNISHVWTSRPNDPDVAPQSNDLEIMVNPTRNTEYTITAGYGPNRLCAVSQAINLTPLDLPIADLTFNPTFLTCESLDWTAHSASQNAESVTWYVNDIEVSHDETINGRAECDDDSVRISIVAVNGICTDVHDTVIYVRKSQLWFPNVFTPNLNINKTFNAIGHGIVEYELYVYTREGLLVFHTTTLEEGWKGDHNGVECPRAAYTYIARYRNEIEPDVWHSQIGTVILMR
ncbi:MAG: gliding motility-associated C-terminal domain-containing protein [Bacteroidales bacterium]|nr:gliding motility-associated C-terminal domain-containing protein [Bacteroidales bacterium]